MAAFKKPDRYLSPQNTKWVIWLTNQKFKEEWLDLAIELKKDYDMMRIMAMAGFILMSVLLLSAIWLIEGGDAAYVSTVMSFVLTFVVGGSRTALTITNANTSLSRDWTDGTGNISTRVVMRRRTMRL